MERQSTMYFNIVENDAFRLDTYLFNYISKNIYLYKYEIRKLPQHLQMNLMKIYLKTLQKCEKQYLEVFLHSGVEELVLDSPELNPQVFNTISNCINLKSLNVSTSEITNEDLKNIIQTCTKLESLVTDHCPRLWLDNYITENCRNLKSFVVGENRMSIDAPRLIATYCQSLTAIDLGLTYITDEGLSTIVKSCRSLISLNITACPALKTCALQSVADYLPHIKSLNMSWCFIESLQPLIHLTELELLGLTCVSTTLSPNDFGCIIKNNPKLSVLYLGNAHYLNESNVQLLGQLIKLKEIILSDIKFEGDPISFVSLSKCTNIEVLDLAELKPCSPWIMDLIRNFRALKKLDLSGTDITQETLIGLVNILPPNLECLSCNSELIAPTVEDGIRKRFPRFYTLEED